MSRTLPKEYTEFKRERTRSEIVLNRAPNDIRCNVVLACVHLFCDDNLGFLVRAAACFGATEVLVIGSIPSYKEIKRLSCGMNDFIDIKVFASPGEFLKYTRDNDIHVVSLELTEQSIDITEYSFPTDKRVCIIIGNESLGVPGEIIHNSDCVAIPMIGVGPCLNTAQAANVALYEYVRQIYKK